MKTPLTVYTEQAKDLGITDELNVPMIARLSFVREQGQQMAQVVNRLLYDLALTELGLQAAKDDTTKAAIEQQKAKYINDLRQTRDSLIPTLELVKELEAQLDK